MATCVNRSTALLVSAVFIYANLGFVGHSAAQAPIVDASLDTAVAATPAEPPAVDNSAAQSELFYQLQLLQREVMQLRGIVEEQTHQLKQLKDQNTERYIELDRRMGELIVGGGAAQPVASGVTPSPVSVTPAQTYPGEKQAYDHAYSLVTSRRFDEALETFKQFLVNFPNGKYSPNSLYWMGELYQVIQPVDLEGARQSFTLLLDQYPGHPKVPDALYKLGKVYFLKGNRSKSRQLLDQVVAEYGKGSSSTAADKAKQFINANF